MIDHIANFFLLFCDPPLIYTLFILGFLFINRAVFIHSACLCSFDIITNVALKGSFKLPASAIITHASFAFPSGHMQFSTVFYVWLGLQYPSWLLRGIIVILLAGIAASLIHYNLHDIYDIMGGLFFGLLLVYSYRYLVANIPEKLPWLLLATGSILMFYNGFLYGTIADYAWTAFYTLCGLVLVERSLTACKE